MIPQQLLQIACFQKKPSYPVIGLWNRGPLKSLNDTKLILNYQGQGVTQTIGPCFYKLFYAT